MCVTRTTITLTAETDKKLKELTGVLGPNNSNVVGIAINRLHTRIEDLKSILEEDNAPIDIKNI